MGDPSLNERVLFWARGEVGKSHGTWECWHFVDAALKQAGGMSSTTHGKKDDYVWGDPLDLQDVKLGDILQFRDFVVETITVVDISVNGQIGKFVEQDVKKRPHHTGIVDGIIGTNQLSIIELHVKPDPKKVRRNVIPREGERRAPVSSFEDYRDPQGKVHKNASVARTVTIKVSGKVWAYRPKPNKN